MVTDKINMDTDIFIQAETEWFADVLNHQFHSYFNPDQVNAPAESFTPPDTNLIQSHYAHFIKEHQLGWQERLAIMLALMPHLQPNLLDIFFTKNSHFDRPFSEFGGVTGKRHAGFLPTGETLHFILHKGALQKRFETIQLLSPDGALVQNDALRIDRSEPGEPMLSGALTISEEFIYYLTTGVRKPPQMSEIFPATKIVTALDWNDLVLDQDVLEEIDLIRVSIANENMLRDCIAFSKHVKPGFRALFYGPPGTGKTLTACLLGKATGMDVYRIDLSMVVSKYIGETEKNLGRIFDYAEKRNWILFFDEADSLFGKRTQTSSSHDRYANQEVSYLLQRVEDFPGTIILASNLKSNIDEAFARRFQSMIYFPMPDADQRLQLWMQFFSGSIKPDTTITLSDIAKKYELSGGAAINVFRYCALKAAQRKSTTVVWKDVQEGMQREFQKYGKTI